MSTLKLKKFTVLIASSLCLWNIDIASANAVQLTFTNNTNQIATDFHFQYEENDLLFTETLDADTGFGPIPIGKSFRLPEELNKRKFVSARWSFAQGEEKPAEPDPPPQTAPEPTTIFGSALALGVGGWLKRKKSSRQNKTTSQN
jgi:hypothetical protein